MCGYAEEILMNVKNRFDVNINIQLPILFTILIGEEVTYTI